MNDVKRCSKCEQVKPCSEFYRYSNGKYKSRCIVCTKEDRKANNDYHRKYYSEYNKRPEVLERLRKSDYAFRQNPITRPIALARASTKEAIRMGRIQREPCAICGATPSDAHHLDYSQYHLIQWLCAPHHREVHQVIKGVSNGG